MKMVSDTGFMMKNMRDELMCKSPTKENGKCHRTYDEEYER